MAGSGTMSWTTVLLDELRRIFTFKPAFATLIIGVAIYTVFYPQPYLAEALRDVPIAIVDQDGTTASRELARRLDATPDVALAMALPDLPNANREVFRRTVFAVVVIPQYFERDLLHERASPIAVYADASYFLIFQRITIAISAVARTLGTEIETARLIGEGIDPSIAPAVASPMELTAVPLFNPQGGYATYILPAAFVLLLQQTLLIATGLLGTLPAGTQGQGGPAPSPLGTVIGKCFAYLLIEAAIVPLYLIVLPYLYGVPRLGSVWAVLAVAVPFVLSVGALGLVLAAVFRTPPAVQLAGAAVGLPFFFLAGFSWPVEAMPYGIRLFATLVPSTSAIDAIVKVSQMGASLSDVRAQLLTTWTLALAYGALAVLLEKRKRRPAKYAEVHGLARVPTDVCKRSGTGRH
jgi:ABC-2 type transport system permease protein